MSQIGSLQAEQLELFHSAPFAVRLQIGFGLEFFWENYWCHKPKGRTSRRCISRLIRFFELRSRRYVDEISKADIEELRRWLGTVRGARKGDKPLSEPTKNTHHMIVTLWINTLYEWREQGDVFGVDFRPVALPATNPGTLVQKVKEQQFASKMPWPKRVIYKLVASAQRLADQFMADLIEGLYLSKLRFSDYGRLTEKNVDFPHKAVFGIQHKTITRRCPSGIPFLNAMGPRLEKILRRRVAAVKPGDPLFWDPDMEWEAWRRSIVRRFNIIRGFARLPHVQLKHFRSSAVTLMMDNGVDSETLRESGGWTTERMLPVYVRRGLRHQREAQAVLEDEDTEILL